MGSRDAGGEDRPHAGTASRRYRIGAQELAAPALAPGLYVVATPIGNLRDITLRALEILAAADVVACEDTRVTRKLLDHYAIAAPLTPYHDHNAAQARPKLLARLAAGARVALVSDAGTPLVSDPGYKLVRAAHAAGHAVSPAPGASAVLAALAVAGLPTDAFHFTGFLPAKAQARRRRISALARLPATLVLFETGPRVAGALGDLAALLGHRDAAVCREMTKLHEEVRRGSLTALAESYAAAPEPRGEMVLVIGPADEAAQPSPAETEALLRAALARASVKDAVAEVAAVTGEPRGDVYRRALAIVKDPGDAPSD
jgi:16S rRNA (cytidine1402-2'-O)-methyltransferase